MHSRVMHHRPDDPAATGAATVEVTVTPAADPTAPSLSDGELVVAAAAGAAVEASRNATERAGAAAATADSAADLAAAALARAEAAEQRAAAAEARAAAAEATAAATAIAAVEEEGGDPDAVTELEVQDTTPAAAPEAPKEAPSMFARLFLGM